MRNKNIDRGMLSQALKSTGLSNSGNELSGICFRVIKFLENGFNITLHFICRYHLAAYIPLS
jgi:hypothetical protein